jgi:hypothetical protein
VQTSKLLLAPGGKVLATTIQENAPMMKELLDVNPTTFFPSIPHLVRSPPERERVLRSYGWLGVFKREA